MTGKNDTRNRPSHPGETITDIITERGLQTELVAAALDLNIEGFEQLLAGDLVITRDIAVALATYLGSTPQFWLNREAQYRTALTTGCECHVEPVEGMHGTLSYGSDRYPYEVVRIVNKRTIEIRELDEKRNPGGTVTFASRANLPTRRISIETFTRRGPNTWVCKGIPTRGASRFLSLGVAESHQDPSR